MRRKRYTAYAAFIVTAVLLAQGCATTSQNNSDKSQASASPTWQKVMPGGETECSDGTDYAFYTRLGDPSRLLFYLEGGGGCWNTQTCDPLGQPSYTVNLNGFDPSEADGIFNFNRADNPLRDHTIVFVPYCSGDVHIGDAEKTYERTPEWIEKLQKQGVQTDLIEPRFKVAHSGLANASAALSWIEESFTADQQTQTTSVIVAGSSAGSIPSPYYALLLARLFPEAAISQLGDGSGGYRRINQSASPHLAWDTVAALQADPAFRNLDEDSFNFETLYLAAHAAEPDIRLNAYDTAEDDVQLQFLRLGGLQVPSLHEAIKKNQSDIRAQNQNFRSYIAGGELHTILRRPEFYQISVGNRSVRDWVADLVAGKPLENVECTECK